MEAKKDKLEVLYIGWDCAKKKRTNTTAVNDSLILDKNIGETTAWLMAAEKGQLDMFHILWESANSRVKVRIYLSFSWRTSPPSGPGPPQSRGF